MYKNIKRVVAGISAAPFILMIWISYTASVQAADIRLELIGDVTSVQSDPVSGGTPSGITTDDFLEGYLIYDDSTGLVQDGLRHYQMIELLIRVPDANQASGSFLLTPPLDSGTRAVFDHATDEFVGIHLPTPPGPLEAFGLSDVDFQAWALTLGNQFAFRQTTPVVEGFWTVEYPTAVIVPIPVPALGALAALLIVLGARRSSRS